MLLLARRSFAFEADRVAQPDAQNEDPELDRMGRESLEGALAGARNP